VTKKDLIERIEKADADALISIELEDSAGTPLETDANRVTVEIVNNEEKIIIS
jgi:hypothetical protein